MLDDVFQSRLESKYWFLMRGNFWNTCVPLSYWVHQFCWVQRCSWQELRHWMLWNPERLVLDLLPLYDCSQYFTCKFCWWDINGHLRQLLTARFPIGNPPIWGDRLHVQNLPNWESSQSGFGIFAPLLRLHVQKSSQVGRVPIRNVWDLCSPPPSEVVQKSFKVGRVPIGRPIWADFVNWGLTLYIHMFNWWVSKENETGLRLG